MTPESRLILLSFRLAAALVSCVLSLLTLAIAATVLLM